MTVCTQVTQLVFALVAPGNMTSNLMAAAISGAGASQAGDMMQVWILRRLAAYLFTCAPAGLQDRAAAEAVSQTAIPCAVYGHICRYRRRHTYIHTVHLHLCARQ